MKLSTIRPNPNNPRVLRDDKFQKLKKSITDFPKMMELRPIVVDDNVVILGGNMRYRALQDIYGKNGEIPDAWVKSAADLTEDEKRQFVIKDNADFGEWDWDMLANEWDAEELADWGIDTPADWGKETKEVEEDDFDTDKDEVETVCQKGDIFQLGDHRLMCGDSTDAASVALLMDGQKADITFTSPPYNAGFGKCLTKDNGRSKYTNGSDDNLSQSEYREFLQKSINNALASSEFSFFNIQMLANNKTAFVDILHDNVKNLADIIVWDKQRAQPQLAERVLNSVVEFVLCFSDKGTRAIGVKKFHGTLENIIHIPPKHNEFSEEHNAVFPIDLPTHFINNFSEKSVLDLFGGSGTTMIAAEQLGRKCYMMELDPHYCDVIIARWEKLTGKKAEKINRPL